MAEPIQETAMPGVMGPVPAGKKEHRGLFGKKEESPSFDVGTITASVSTVNRRVRLLEERYTNLRKRTQLMEQNMLGNYKKTSTEIKMFNAELDEVKRSITELQEKVVLIIKELKLCAKKEDVEVLKKYITLWDPVNFVTKNQVENIVNDAIEEIKPS